MKICTIICEYNPFHNGHLYQLREAKKRSGTDALLCLMSGNFVQRGESAVCDKFTRAKHAILGGADVVIELPTLFATSNAELFAKGAISLLSAIPDATTLSFGAEIADKQAFLSTANTLLNEPLEVSNTIKRNVALGMSYAKARADAWSEILPSALLQSPNSILGIEYTKAILESRSSLDILPIERVGSGYKDTAMQTIYSSATAIRTALANQTDCKGQVPDFVYPDLPKELETTLDALEKYAILSKAKEEIAKVLDCTEGLENAFKRAAVEKELLYKQLTSPRYTASRIRRIALQNLLNIDKDLILEALHSPLYLRVLAVNKKRSDLFSALSQSGLPILARAHDEDCLTGVAKKVYEIDLFAEKIYTLPYENLKNKSIFI